MSNPTYRQGPIGFEIAKDLDQFHLVAVNADGKITYADSEGPVFGAITENGRLDHTAASNLPVHYGVAAVYLSTEADVEIKANEAVYAGDNGKAAATGTVQVGVAAENSTGTRVLTVLNGLPYAATV